MKKIIVLGGTGMLGSMVTDLLSRESGLKIFSSSRGAAAILLRDKIPGVEWTDFDAMSPDIDKALAALPLADWVINAIGITKPLVRDDNAFEVERAICVNSLFPHRLAAWAEKRNARIIQIATDCVWSGQKGAYSEVDAHDALDVYGKTKSLGEVHSPAVSHLRCSIIGPEPKENKFLIEWFRRQPKNAAVRGFLDHRWNGVTTLQFARLCLGMIRENLKLPRLIHVVPDGTISKADLLACFAEAYGRTDLRIDRVESGKVVDRTLGTVNSEANTKLWTSAGYTAAPSVPSQILELSQFDYRGSPAFVAP